MSRVLIVEDHLKLLHSLQRGLEHLGYEVVVAETGEEGLAIALSTGVDLVVLDLMLPGKNGFEILTELRQAGSRQPVLILTAKDSPEDRRRGRECGADDFLIKPFAFSDLAGRIHALLGHTASASPTSEPPPCVD